jgi:WD40 repeat protein
MALSLSRVKHVISAHPVYINDANYSPNGKMLATASEDSTVAIWRTSATPTPSLLTVLGLWQDTDLLPQSTGVGLVVASQLRRDPDGRVRRCLCVEFGDGGVAYSGCPSCECSGVVAGWGTVCLC